jgi:hypothetical protein
MQRTFMAGLVAACLAPALVQAQGQEIVILDGANPRVEFLDTTNPTRSWVVNGNNTGFGIRDTDTGNFPFFAEAGVPNNRLILKANGNVGIGTDVPGFPFHFATGPRNARMATFTQLQDGTSSGNRDAIVGVENSAPFSLINRVGIDLVVKSGSQASRPAARISARMLSDVANSVGVLEFVPSNGASVTVTPMMSIIPGRVSIGTPLFTHLLRVGNASCNGATWTTGSSRAIKHDIADLSAEEARAAVMALTPVTYAYNDSPDDPSVGFIAEDVPELVAMPDRTGLNPLEIVAALTKVVQEQDREVATLRQQLADQQAAFEARLQELEARMGDAAP